MKNNTLFKFVGVLVICLFHIQLSIGQSVITNEEKQFVVDSVAKIYSRNYVFSEVGEKMAQQVQDNFKNGKYTDILNPLIFAEQLELDLMSINGDKHISVVFDPITIGQYLRSLEDGEEFDIYPDEISAFSNHYFEEVKILSGNIGYIKLSQFSDADGVAETISAAMAYLQHTDAIIFDVRKNRGGSPYTVQLLISYFLRHLTQISTIYNRTSESYKQIWSIPLMKKYNMPGKEVVVLAGAGSHSAAEGFAYEMKHLGLATVVGQTTAGAAHLTSYFPVNDNFYVAVPTGRGMHAATETNWEGKGVEPDIRVEDQYALDTARLLLLDKLKNQYDEEDFRQDVFKWEYDRLQALKNPRTLDKKDLKKHCGQFENVKIYQENNKLFYKKREEAGQELFAMGNGQFMFANRPDYRLEFIIEDDEAIAIQGVYSNGRNDWYDKED